MAEWLRRGLQILARRFDSGSGLHLRQSFLRDRIAISRAGRLPLPGAVRRVAGSSPADFHLFADFLIRISGFVGEPRLPVDG